MQEWELKPEEIKDRLQDMTWSFSRVSSIGSCLYYFYIHYIEGCDDEENCWGQFGLVVHQTIEKFLKGEIDMFGIVDYYKDLFDEIVTCDFPPNKYVDLKEKSYLDGLEYFSNLYFDFDRYEILGVEQELAFNVGKYPFKGYADAIYRDRQTGEIILRDHKTSNFKYLKNGNVSKTNAEQFKHYRYQEYLYCIPLIEKYRRVDKLSWNMIRDQRIIEIPFDEKEFKEAQEWAINNIHILENEMLWLPDNSNMYYCKMLCGQRGGCIYRP